MTEQTNQEARTPAAVLREAEGNGRGGGRPSAGGVEERPEPRWEYVSLVRIPGGVYHARRPRRERAVCNSRLVNPTNVVLVPPAGMRLCAKCARLMEAGDA